MPAATFSIASRGLFDALAPLGQRRRHAAGSIVIREGEPGESLFIVHSGSLRACIGASGERLVELNGLGPGDIFGELCIGLPYRTATVEVTATAQLTEVPRAAAQATLVQRPELALELMDSLIARIGFLTHRVRGLVSMDVYGRMVDLLVSLAQRENGQVVLPRLTQQAIAERIGSSRSMVNRLLKGLVMGGYLVIENDQMLLMRPLPRSW